MARDDEGTGENYSNKEECGSSKEGGLGVGGARPAGIRAERGEGGTAGATRGRGGNVAAALLCTCGQWQGALLTCSSPTFISSAINATPLPLCAPCACPRSPPLWAPPPRPPCQVTFLAPLWLPSPLHNRRGTRSRNPYCFGRAGAPNSMSPTPPRV